MRLFNLILTYRYKLKPTRAQYAALDALLEDQRQLYNAALKERIDAWKKSKTAVTKLDQFKSLTVIRSFDETYAAVSPLMSRWSIARVDDAFKGFFSRIKRGDKPGFPRFRSFYRWRSFGFAEFSGIRLKGDKLLFEPFKAGLELNLHRDIPEGSDLKSCTFTKSGRHWWVTIAVDVPVAEAEVDLGRAVGIDIGVEHLVTTSDGRHIENIRPRKKRGRDILVAQRALARCNKNSNRRKKVKAKLARLLKKVAHARSTHLHQVSSELTKQYSFIAAEGLKVKNMTASARGTVEEPGKNVRQKAGLNGSMLDASFSKLIDYTSYKAERAGGMLVKVKPHYTSQDCSSCGVRAPKTLAMRMHRCDCGTVLQRDVNAARNILERALEAHRRARPPGDGNVGHQPERRLGTTSALAT